MEENKKSIFIAIPAFSAHGDVMDDLVLDACAESLEIPASNIKVVERNDNFYVFTDDLPIELHAANQAIVNAKQINKNYEHSVLNLSKLVRRADAQVNRSRDLHSEIKSLKAENEKMTQKLQELQKEVEEKKLKSNQIQKGMEQIVDNLA